MNFITTARFDMPTLHALTEDPDVVERLVRAAAAAGRTIDEGELRLLMQDAVVEAVENRAGALEREVRDAEEAALFNERYPLSAAGDGTAEIPEIASAVTTHTFAPFVAATEPNLEDFRYCQPWVPDTAGQVDVSITGRAGSPVWHAAAGDGDMFSTICASFLGKRGAKMMFTVDVGGREIAEGTLAVRMVALDDEPNETGFYGRIEHCATAKTKHAWRRGEVPYNDVRLFVANALEAFSSNMGESFEHVAGAVDGAFEERRDTPVVSPSPSPRPHKRARSETRSPLTPESY